MTLRTTCVATLMALAAALPSHAASAVDAAAAFARLKALAGEWQGDTSAGKARLTYEIVADGTAILEREWAERIPEMVTMYHLDGERLLLTHYCMAGNQPRMQATAYDPASGTLTFALVDATGLASPDAGHMHAVRIEFAGPSELVTHWQFFVNGRPESTETGRYTRIR
jgi:hypothetical protein